MASTNVSCSSSVVIYLWSTASDSEPDAIAFRLTRWLVIVSAAGRSSPVSVRGWGRWLAGSAVLNCV
ncbi:hypothetical protein RISK_004433 [Rhodopirellula islandica]|uniref:Uncharacterized protein n=1 Tax=Rhodopirellula islandica TaxID=595434 RepID=A0A0J1BAL9_RHOIS|nr:hypothetical protein RISK_004433 [Rhodopirellula islandica]